MLDFGTRDTLYIKRTTANTYRSNYNLGAKEALAKNVQKTKNKVKTPLLFKTPFFLGETLWEAKNSRKDFNN